MSFEEFLTQLSDSGWLAPNKSFAYLQLFEEWQISFIRLGGKHQSPGQASFIIGVRHISLCDLDGQYHPIEKEPHCFPFIFTLSEIISKDFAYKSKLLNYDITRLNINDDWSNVFFAMTVILPDWLSKYSKHSLVGDILKFGQNGYIEKLWLSDLLK